MAKKPVLGGRSAGGRRARIAWFHLQQPISSPNDCTAELRDVGDGVPQRFSRCLAARPFAPLPLVDAPALALPRGRVVESIPLFGVTDHHLYLRSGSDYPQESSLWVLTYRQRVENYLLSSPICLNSQVFIGTFYPVNEGSSSYDGFRYACSRAVRRVGFGHLPVPAFRLISYTRGEGRYPSIRFLITVDTKDRD